jgi:hypothetical protein
MTQVRKTNNSGGSTNTASEATQKTVKTGLSAAATGVGAFIANGAKAVVPGVAVAFLAKAGFDAVSDTIADVVSKKG